jgi:radical SAM superfamily enzyme YgiQ (UPF0313 family)
MSNITLISPYDSIVANGIRKISSYLKKNGHHVELVFLPYKTKYSGHFDRRNYKKEVAQDLISLCKDSDLIGFTVMTNYFLKVKDLTVKLKKHLNAPIIWGGIHPTMRPEECLKYADIVCVGEGEETMLELAEKLPTGNIKDIKNLWLKDKSRIIKNDIRPLEENLDKYPFMDYDIDTHYILRDNRIVRMTGDLLKESMPFEDEQGEYRALLLIDTVRNCPHNCTFCSNSALKEAFRGKGRFVRKRSVKRVIEEIAEITKKFPFIRHIEIADETFFVRSREEIEEFSRMYKEKINLPLGCSLSPQTLDRSKLKLMVDAGLFRTSIGIQSLDDHTLIDIYKRPVPKEMVSAMVELLDKYKSQIPRPVYHFIVDNPYEPKSSIIKGIKFVVSLPVRTKINLYPLVFYPGTELYNRAKKDGLIKNEIKEVYLKSWTLESNLNLDYLTCLFYIAVWVKLSKFLDKIMKKSVMFLTKEKTIRLLDNKITVFFLVLFLNTFVFSINVLRKLR